MGEAEKLRSGAGQEEALVRMLVERATDDANRTPPLAQPTMRRLLHDILAGVYGPGERIREVEVAERLGVSRAPVREALRVLEQDGLVEITPWRGARVINPEPSELLDLLGTVYGTVARFAVSHASDADLQRLSRDMQRIGRDAKSGRDVIDLVDAAYQIGTHLGDCCGNRIAAETLRRLGRVAYLRHRFLRPVPKRWLSQSLTRMRRFEEALLARSEARAEKAVWRVIQHTANLILKRAIEAHQVAARLGEIKVVQGRLVNVAQAKPKALARKERKSHG